MLTALDDNLWEAEYALSVTGVQLGHRMTVIRLADNELMLHSPVPLADDLARELGGLRRVEGDEAARQGHGAPGDSGVAYGSRPA